MTTKPWSLAQCCERYASASVGGISIWRNVIEPIGIAEASRIVQDSGLAVPALVRGGFFVSSDAAQRAASLDENRTCLDEAAALGAEMVVLVVGASPDIALHDARQMVVGGIQSLLPHAESLGVKLAIEPLHPMYAADRSCINRIQEARAVCDDVAHSLVGVAVDVYHVWWDPDLVSQIDGLGREGRLFGFHVCDWRTPMRDPLNDRGLMGEGCIDIRGIRAMVERAGFAGFNEVEIFSERYWAEDQDRYLASICDAYVTAT
ncbi:MAG: sugar phosphate isomerase/epimerase family protein [Planctomycetota bacterium]